MQNGDDDEPILAEMIKERVGKSAKENAAKRAIGLVKRKRMPLGKRDRLINCGKEVVAEVA